MSSTAPSIQVCRECGGGAPVDVHFCPQCTKILTLGRQGDYFAFMSVPRRLTFDAAALWKMASMPSTSARDVWSSQ